MVKNFEKFCVQFKIKIYVNVTVTIHYLVKAGITINFVIFEFKLFVNGGKEKTIIFKHLKIQNAVFYRISK